MPEGDDSMSVMRTAAELPIRAISIDDFQRMGEIGVFAENEHVELLDGRPIAMPPQSEEHAFAIQRISEVLRAAIGLRGVLRSQSPIALNEFTHLEPDVVVLRTGRADEGIRLPGAADVVLAVEVSRSSLAYDRGEKRDAYAGAGVPELWVVDLVHRRVEVSDLPRSDGYRRTVVLTPGDDVRLCEYEVRISIAAFLT